MRWAQLAKKNELVLVLSAAMISYYIAIGLWLLDMQVRLKWRDYLIQRLGIAT